MTYRIRNSYRLLQAARFAVTLLALLLTLSSPAFAEDQPAATIEPLDQASSSDAAGPPAKRPCKKGQMGKKAGHGKMGHDRHGGHGKRHQGHGDGWKASLTDEQRRSMKALKVEHMKTVVPLKMKIKAVKAELAALVTADKVDQAAIEAKIDDLLWHKRLKMIEHYRYKAAKRELLTPDQRLDFDLAMMKRAKHDKRGHHGKHKH